jgi:hypothetical protein
MMKSSAIFLFLAGLAIAVPYEELSPRDCAANNCIRRELLHSKIMRVDVCSEAKQTFDQQKFEIPSPWKLAVQTVALIF